MFDLLQPRRDGGGDDCCPRFVHWEYVRRNLDDSTGTQFDSHRDGHRDNLNACCDAGDMNWRWEQERAKLCC